MEQHHANLASGPVTWLEAGTGAPAFLLHGAHGSPETWGALVPHLSAVMRPIVPELSIGASLAEHAQVVRELAAHLELAPGYAVLGHAEGGGVAQLLALSGQTKVLVLVGSIAFTDELQEVERAFADRDDIYAFLLWGEDDTVIPPEVGERLMEALPGSTMALVPDAGHEVLTTDGDTIFPLIYEWLRFRYLGRDHGHAPQGGVPVQVFLERPPERFR
jgi:pimeloyl-ACP methyl ester carboxylesterase